MNKKTTGMMKQVKITSLIESMSLSSTLWGEFDMNLLRTFTKANIPLEKAAALDFLKKHSQQNGACPTTADNLIY